MGLVESGITRPVKLLPPFLHTMGDRIFISHTINLAFTGLEYHSSSSEWEWHAVLLVQGITYRIEYCVASSTVTCITIIVDWRPLSAHPPHWTCQLKNMSWSCAWSRVWLDVPWHPVDVWWKLVFMLVSHTHTNHICKTARQLNDHKFSLLSGFSVLFWLFEV